MDKNLLSVGLDVGTTTTQMILSRLAVENKGSAFSVPELAITQRHILYKSPIHFTPLSGKDRVDADALRALIGQEYRAAGITPAQVDTGAVIITGETSRKENARAVLHALSDLAGDFVVATAGPHLESVLAAKGAGADTFSADTGKTVLHMDIGGGTANLALICRGSVVATGCMNIGGRLIKRNDRGVLLYRSPVLEGLFSYAPGQTPTEDAVYTLCRTLTEGLEMAAGLRAPTALLQTLWTEEAGAPWRPPEQVDVFSFSGGVAECMDADYPPLAFGDMGPTLGKALKSSLLCRGEYLLGQETIRATVIGAGCHSTQLSGSTVFYDGVSLPLKNLPVILLTEEEQRTASLPTVLRERLAQQEGQCVLAFPGFAAASYGQICGLADGIVQAQPPGAVLITLEQDMAKALGQALRLRLPKGKPILCIDRVKLADQCYLDIGAPVGSALPVVIKTLILEK